MLVIWVPFKKRWWLGTESNRRHKDFQSFALPTELPSLGIYLFFHVLICMEEEEGFEPPRALTPLSVFKTDPFNQTWVFLRTIWWTLQDSNLRPIGYEPIALTS